MSIRAATAHVPGCSAPPARLRLRGAGMAGVALVVLGLLASSARAEGESTGAQPDAWWGTDKALHFGSCVGLSALGYGLGVWAFDDRLAAARRGSGARVAAARGWGAVARGLLSLADVQLGIRIIIHHLLLGGGGLFVYLSCGTDWNGENLRAG